MFEAVVNAGRTGGSRAGAPASAAAKKLERNKNRVLSTPSPAQMLDSMRRELGSGVQLTAAQRKLARGKGGGGMRASLGERCAVQRLFGDAGQPCPASRNSCAHLSRKQAMQQAHGSSAHPCPTSQSLPQKL